MSIALPSSINNERLDVTDNDDDHDGKFKDSDETVTAVHGDVDGNDDDAKLDTEVMTEPLIPSDTGSTTTRPTNTVQPPLPPPHRKRRSFGRTCCCICGCITLTLLIAIIALMITIYFFIASYVKEYTVQTPMILSTNNTIVPKAEIDNTIEEMEQFVHCYKYVPRKTDFMLTSQFLNGVLNAWDYTSGYAQVILNENEILFHSTLPIWYYITGGKHRYFCFHDQYHHRIDTTT
jgi:hypothetical protein